MIWCVQTLEAGQNLKTPSSCDAGAGQLQPQMYDWSGKETKSLVALIRTTYRSLSISLPSVGSSPLCHVPEQLSSGSKHGQSCSEEVCTVVVRVGGSISPKDQAPDGEWVGGRSNLFKGWSTGPLLYARFKSMRD